MTNYEKTTENFNTILDFLRFGLSEANTHNLYYGHGTDNAWDDLLALILGSLNLPFDINPLLLQAQLTCKEKEHLAKQISKRILDNIPVPYLTNTAHFCGLSFYVDERVLIPRSPIAELIQQQFSPWANPEKVHNILDLCTGSACIAIACQFAFPDAHVTAIDISPDALEVAAINCRKHNLEEAIDLIQSDCWTNVPNKPYDLIISNPPYVSSEEMQTLPAEYLHEPNLALEAKNEGLDIVEKILLKASRYLSPEGVLVVEVGNTEETVVEKFHKMPFTWLEFENGGQGVFLLTAEQLNETTNILSS